MLKKHVLQRTITNLSNSMLKNMCFNAL